jgi:hypothetical protein
MITTMKVRWDLKEAVSKGASFAFLILGQKRREPSP